MRLDEAADRDRDQARDIRRIARRPKTASAKPKMVASIVTSDA